MRAEAAASARGGSPDAAAIEASGGSVIRAATSLDVRPRQPYRWIERFGVALDAYRDKA